MKLSNQIRFWKHLVKLVQHNYFGRVRYEDSVAEAMIGIAARWHGEIDPFYSYMAMLDVLKQSRISGEGLEIGGGYSTILFSQLVDRNNMRIESIDMNPDKYLRIIPRSRTRRHLFERIHRIDRLSVSLEQVLNSYNLDLYARISEVGSDRYILALQNFIRDKHTFTKNHIDLFKHKPEDWGRLLLKLPDFKEEEKFYLNNGLKEEVGYCLELQQQGRTFDFIFFDCGEYSSLAEWFILEKQIKVGGFALLHDIYYPKSVKNFLVACFISVSEDWEIVYKDAISQQGALVAKKVK
jgi:predicted O-methyltransferase YrrM